jgi:hypothetical protein
MLIACRETLCAMHTTWSEAADVYRRDRLHPQTRRRNKSRYLAISRQTELTKKFCRIYAETRDRKSECNILHGNRPGSKSGFNSQ